MLIFRPQELYFRSQSIGPDLGVLFSVGFADRNAVSQLSDLFQTHIFRRGPRPNFRSTSRHPWGLYQVSCTPMDARRKVSIDALSFSPRSQSSDQNLQKNIPDLGPKANLGMGEGPHHQPWVWKVFLCTLGIASGGKKNLDLCGIGFGKRTNDHQICFKCTLNLGPGTLKVR